MKYKSIIFGLFVVAGILLSLPNTSFGAFKVESSDINIETIPENPEPYSDVTIRVSSFATDLNKAGIDWVINNKTVLSGTGKTTYTFKVGAPNTSTSIDVKIIPFGGGSISRQIIVQPSEIEMLWQAVDSYTPAFYKGKALPIQEGKIKVVAFPNTVNIAKANKKNMVYGWSRNNSTQADASGYGKDSFTFTNNILTNTEKIKLSASSVDNTYTSVGSLEIKMANPKLIFYKKSPINGTLYDEALVGSATMTEDEMTIVAEPYFMNRDSRDLQYNWKINSGLIDTPNKKTELTIRPSSRGGYATIGLSIESVTKLFQSINNNLRVNL